MIDHLCVTKMREYLQWIHSFYINQLDKGESIPSFFFSLQEYFGHCGQSTNLSI